MSKPSSGPEVESDSPSSSAESGGRGGGDAEAPPKLSGMARLDQGLYRFEASVVAGALLVMAFTYVLKIIDRDMQAATTAFDKFFLRLKGYKTVGEAPPELVASINEFWSPFILTVSCYLLAVLAFRTRDVLGVDGRPRVAMTPARRKSWWLKGVAATAGIYVALKMVEWVPAKWLCTLALLGLIVPSVLGSLRNRAWGATAGVVVGGGWLTWFFLKFGGSDYVWNDKLSLVLLMYVGFFGASMATRDGRHIKIDAFRKLVPRKHLHAYNGVGNLLTGLFSAFLAFLAVRYHETIGLENKVEGLELGYWMISLPVLIGLSVMALRFVALSVSEFVSWRRGELPPLAEPELH